MIEVQNVTKPDIVFIGKYKNPANAGFCLIIA
jgi:hypothetical protein